MAILWRGEPREMEERNRKFAKRERPSKNQTNLREGMLNDLDQLQEVF
jgi:hypothetical protein